MTTLTRALRYALVPWRAARKWGDDRCATYAAALAYYSAFSLAPVLVIAVSVAGLIFGADTASERIVGELEALIGADGARLIARMVTASQASGQGALAAVVSTVITLIGATGLFVQMGHAFEAVFGHPTQGRSAWMKQLIGRLRGLTVVIGIGFLLMISLVASAAILAVGEYATRGIQALLWLATALQIAISLALQSSMIGIIYKVLVPTKLSTRALMIGAVLTAVLFELGKWAIGLYLGRSNTAAAFGPAGSLAIVLLWVYYVSLILLYGAEITFQLNRIEHVGDRRFRRQKKAKKPAPAPAVEAPAPSADAPATEATPALFKPPASEGNGNPDKGQRPASGNAG